MTAINHLLRFSIAAVSIVLVGACDGMLVGNPTDEATVNSLSCPALQQQCGQGKAPACRRLAMKCPDGGAVSPDQSTPPKPDSGAPAHDSLAPDKLVLAPDKLVLAPDKLVNLPPTVSLTPPAGGTTITSAQTVSLVAVASDDVGVVKVELYDGGTLKSAASTAPFTYAWAVTAAANGTHSWTAKAFDAAGSSSLSAPLVLTVAIPTPPPAPGGVTATASAGAIAIAWSPVAGATSYNLFWSNTSGVTPSTGTKVTGVTSPYLHQPLTPGLAYFYVVVAVNAAGAGPASAQVSATPQQLPDTIAPSFAGLTSATGTSASQITLGWTAASDNVTPSSGIVYLVYQSTTPTVSFAAPAVTTAAGATSAVVPGLAASTVYYFVVRARDTAGNVDGNTVVRSATTSSTTPTTPQPPFGNTVGVTANNFTIPDCNSVSFNLYDEYTKHPAVVVAFSWTGFT